MIKGLYTAATGMINQQQRMDIISNNLANINTTGYKKEGVVVESFDDVLAIKINDIARPNQPIGKMNLGVRLGQVYTEFQQGSLIQTHEPFNLAIQGNGFFTIGMENANGEVNYGYSRDGTFVLSNEGELMTNDGYYVVGENGRIILEQGNVYINESGEIFVNDERVDQLSLVSFDKDALRKLGDNLFVVEDGAEPLEFEGKVLQGFLEESNVNSIREMVDMISIMRTFEANQKVIQTQDETLGKIVNEVGRL